MTKPANTYSFIDDERIACVAAEMIKALAHPVRLRIVACLCQERRHVSHLTELLQTKQSVVSQQLRILRSQGLVDLERVKGFSVYRIAEPRLRDLVRCMEECSTVHQRAAARDES